jgi:hypothetical protein
VLIGTPLLSACAVLNPVPDPALPIANLDLEPKPGQLEPMIPGEVLGPVIEVATGVVSDSEFTLSLYRSADGFCLSLSAIQYGGVACGPQPEDEQLGSIAQSGLIDGTIAIDGTVAADVAAVWVVTDDGRRANALLTPAGLDALDASIFLVFLPEGVHPVMVVAADEEGGIVDELPIVSIAPGGPGAPPAQGS